MLERRGGLMFGTDGLGDGRGEWIVMGAEVIGWLRGRVMFIAQIHF